MSNGAKIGAMKGTGHDHKRGLLASLIGDGRPLLALVAVSLMLAGGFALFLSATGHFLPHDVRFLGMDKEQLCGIHQCRIVHFMFHDRVSFGGALIAIGWLYLWLVQFPLRAGEPWAWWVFVISGISGFGSFLAYLGYGYLDSWHGVATLFLLPTQLLGLVVSWRHLKRPASFRLLLGPAVRRMSLGRLLLLGTGVGLVLGGSTICVVGMTNVFVPQDLRYIGMTAHELNAISPRLLPLIAHDRAGFGGGIATCGLILFFCVWCGLPTRSLWQALALAGGTGFVTAIGIHPLIGYTDFTHLAPAYAGVAMFVAGIVLCYKPMCRNEMALPAGLSPATATFEASHSGN